MSERATDPQTVQCRKCGHAWLGFYLPQPIDIAVKIMRALTCPKCGADAAQIVICTE